MILTQLANQNKFNKSGIYQINRSVYEKYYIRQIERPLKKIKWTHPSLYK